MGRWTQYDEESYRLPEGVVRIGYDADTAIYTYVDSDGIYYEGNPGERYGRIFPVRHMPLEEERHFARSDGGENERPACQTSSPSSPPSPTFSDFLDPSLITTAGSSKPTISRPKARFIAAVRKVTKLRLYDVVLEVMRRRKVQKIKEKNTVEPETADEPTEKAA